jgi:hypothetical protein
MTLSDFMRRQYEGADRRQGTRYGALGNNPFTNRLTDFAARHVVVGSIVQATLTMIPLALLVIVLTHGGDAMAWVLPGIGFLLLLLWTIPYNRWRRNRLDRESL